MIITKQVNVKIPSVPNFLLIENGAEGEKVSIADLKDEELEKIAEEGFVAQKQGSEN